MLSLKSKHAIITGAESGIGKATASLFAQQGAHVHVVDIGEERSNATAKEINNSAGTAKAHVCNVTDQQKLTEVFNAIGHVDVPGDVISTGTPAGVAMGMNPQPYLQPGDEIELGIDGLGTSKQKCVAYAKN